MTDLSEPPSLPIARGRLERLRRTGRVRYLRFRRSFPRLIRTDEVWLVLLAGVVGIGAGLIVATMATLLFVPVVYSLLRKKAPKPEDAEPETEGEES